MLMARHEAGLQVLLFEANAEQRVGDKLGLNVIRYI